MNNKIANEKVMVPKGICQNDKDYLNLLLTNLKEMSKNYVSAMLESSNDDLYKKYFEMFKKIVKLQRETFLLLFKNGWYELECADSNKVNKKYNVLTQEYMDLELE